MSPEAALQAASRDRGPDAFRDALPRLAMRTVRTPVDISRDALGTHLGRTTGRRVSPSSPELLLRERDARPSPGRAGRKQGQMGSCRGEPTRAPRRGKGNRRNRTVT